MPTANPAPPAAPAGYPAAPVTVIAGATVTVPYPANLPIGPVPPSLPYMVVLNSSPYTLLVSQGRVIAQVAAFTSDLVQLTQLGQAGVGVDLMAQQGSGLTVPGQDSTAYATWYERKPAGSFPAALGSGAANFTAATPIIDDSPNVVVGTPQRYGPFSTLSAAGVRFSIVAQLGTTVPLLVQLEEPVVAGPTAAGHNFVLPGQSAAFAAFVSPVIGDELTIVLSANAGSDVGVIIAASLVTTPLAAFGTPTVFGNTDGLYQASFAVGGGGTADLLTPLGIYAGPASLFLNPGGAATWTARLQSQSAVGVWTQIGRWTQADLLGASAIRENVTIPPAPIRLQYDNGTGAPTTPVASLTYDYWRAAA